MSFVVPDLITAEQVTSALNLSPADVARVPATVTAASRMVRNYLGRFITRRPSADGTMGPIDETITPELRGPILLREYPVNDVFRVSSSKTVVFSIQNNDTVNNQRALAKLTRTGGEVQGWSTTGVYLEWWASGVQNTQTILFSGLTSPTLAALAAAVIAVGSGWTAWASGADDAGNDFSLWPVIELRSNQGSVGALWDAAEFHAWTDDLNHEREDQTGTLYLTRDDDNPFNSLRWGPTAGLSFGDEQIRGGLAAIRVVYDAGYDETPPDLADCVVEIVKAMLERKAASSTFLKEKTDTWMIEQREIIDAIPPYSRQVLASYRSNAR